MAHEMCAALPRCYELWDAHFRQLDFNFTTSSAAQAQAQPAADGTDAGSGRDDKSRSRQDL